MSETDPAVRDSGALGAQVATAQVEAGQPVGATEVDVSALQRTIEAMQARLVALESERQPGGPPIVNTAAALQRALQEHASGKTTGLPGATTDNSEILGLGDDLAAAAGNAAESGDGAPVHKIAARIERWLSRNTPPGDHPYLREAASHVADVQDQADDLEPSPQRQPGKVVAGSVVG